MSYDVQAGGDWHNYTYNLSRFFTDFGAQPRDWDGMNRFEVADAIEVALNRIEAQDLDDLHATYDPDNKWGDVESAIEWLRNVRASCLNEIPETVSVS